MGQGIPLLPTVRSASTQSARTSAPESPTWEGPVPTCWSPRPTRTQARWVAGTSRPLPGRGLLCCFLERCPAASTRCRNFGSLTVVMDVSHGLPPSVVSNNTDILTSEPSPPCVCLWLQHLWEEGVLPAPGNPVSFLFTAPRPQVSLRGLLSWSPKAFSPPAPSPHPHPIKTLS